ncbi:DUF2627 domain-containing protein [Thermoflavimicrobium daqui]|uniref:DUF2627 domain-containing protein n=1 Tax=Thermoflavimicrobium daqui TaxID=2137476 RepID=A0A364K8D0_9BACL|nr:DUF2627 domain-containing protein [Thermoflavimicrobium daqui]RAL26547.1 DUF2627 domain-containing protein [Thermoflavimicrobium daqui]
MSNPNLKPVYQRILAILILCIPGALGIYGWTIIRDVLFNYFANQGFAWLPFLGGTLLLLIALYFLGGFIFYRDKKNNRIQPKLLSKEEQEKLAELKKSGQIKKDNDKYSYYKKL